MAAANRFSHQHFPRIPLRALLSALLFAAVLGVFAMGLSSISATTDTESLRAVQKAVANAAVHCYAVEGAYPPNIGYLEENYGLSVDRSRFQVHYRCFASNLFPDITVFAHQAGTGGSGI